MDKAKAKPSGNIITEILTALWNVWLDMFKSLMKFLPRIISFVLWALCAVIILPCVYVAGQLYPMWLDWGKDL